MRFEKVPIFDFGQTDYRVIVDLDLDKVVYYREFKPYAYSEPYTLILVGEKTIQVNMPHSEFDKLIKGL